MENTDSKPNQIKCKGCGAFLIYKPGTTDLHCEYCGAHNTIATPVDAEPVHSVSLEDAFEQLTQASPSQEESVVSCKGCGATTTLSNDTIATKCPYCATPIAIQQKEVRSLLKPMYLLPFGIEKKQAADSFRTWVKSLWFAPSHLQELARTAGIDGLYVPYWTYDADTNSQYSGQRGTYYYETETYEEEDDQGRTVTRSREVQRILWTPAFGRLSLNFEDLLVCADQALPQKLAGRLQNWDLENLIPYDNAYFSGFRASTYSKDLRIGFEEAKQVMVSEIRNAVHRDIGGDIQEIFSLNSEYTNPAFKYLLLPVWLSSYRYNDKVYRFMVNARTGEIEGERPYSSIKIAFTVIAILVALILLFMITGHHHTSHVVHVYHH